MKGPETFRSLSERNLLYLYEGPETFRSLSERNLLYLYEGPRDLQKPLGKEFVIPI